MVDFHTRTIERPAVPRLERIAAPPRASSTPVRSGNVAEDSISRSLEVVERAVGNLAALRESCNYFKGLAVELRDAVDDERQHATTIAEKLADAERSQRAERDRADRAEHRLHQAAQRNGELERQLAAVNARTDRLVRTIATLMSAGKGGGAREVDIADLLAA